MRTESRTCPRNFGIYSRKGEISFLGLRLEKEEGITGALEQTVSNHSLCHACLYIMRWRWYVHRMLFIHHLLPAGWCTWYIINLNLRRIVVKTFPRCNQDAIWGVRTMDSLTKIKWPERGKECVAVWVISRPFGQETYWYSCLRKECL